MSRGSDERDEYVRLFELQRAAEMRGIKRWQSEAPGRELTWPDRANMVVWLLDRLEAAEAAPGRPFKVLDLYCGEGGAARGYQWAGASLVMGVDLKATRRYPGIFMRGDALTLEPAFIRQFDLVHASPPCQFGTELNSDKGRHLNLIPATRRLLRKAGVPYVIENVRGVARAGYLTDPVSLFGTMFDLHMVTSAGQRFDLSRERCFETSWGLTAPHDPGPRNPIANVFGGHLRARSGEYRTGGSTGRTRDFPGEDKPALARRLMGMPWATMNGMSEAVPPAFTAYIGQRFRARLQQREAA